MPGKSHGQKSLAGYTVHGVTESDTAGATEHACPHHSLSMDKQSEVQRGQVIHPRGHHCGGRPRIPSQALESTSTRIATLIAGVPKLCDLVPDDLRWSRCKSNRNKVHNKRNHPNHPQSIPPPRVRGSTVFHEAGPRCQKGRDPWVEPPRSTAPCRASHSPLQGRGVVFSGESSSLRAGNPILLVLVLMCFLFIGLKMFLMEHPLKECGRGFPRQSSGEDSALSLLGAWVPSLVRKRRSHKRCGVAQKHKINSKSVGG